MLENLESSVSSSEHFRFLWYPHTGYVKSYHVSRTSKVFEVLKACYIIMVSICWILNEGLRAWSCYKQTVFWVHFCNVVTRYMYKLVVKNVPMQIVMSFPFRLCVNWKWRSYGLDTSREISNSISSNLAILLRLVEAHFAFYQVQTLSVQYRIVI